MVYYFERHEVRSSKEDANGWNVRRKSTSNVNPYRDPYSRGHRLRIFYGWVLGGSVTSHFAHLKVFPARRGLLGISLGHSGHLTT